MTGGWLRRPWRVPALCAVLAVVVYAAGLDAPFIFDDHDAILENPYLRAPFPDCLTAPPESPISGRPLVTLSLVLNHRVSGIEPWSYHVFNLVVHMLVAALLADLLRRTVSHEPLGKHLGSAGPVLVLAVPLVWVVHPLNIDAVTYVIQRTELLMALGYVGTLWASVRAWDSPRRGLWSAAAVASCALGMLSKEVMVSAPLMVLLYDRAFRSTTWRECFQRRAPLYLGLAATWCILAPHLIDPARSRSVGTQHGTSSLQYLTAQCAVILEYLKLSGWPHPLTLDHGESLARPAWAVALGAFTLVTAFMGTLVAGYRGSPWGFVGAWFFLILGPTSSVLPIVSEPAAERRMYLPLMGVLIPLVLGVHALLVRRRVAPGGRALLLAGVVLGLGAATVARNLEYQNVLDIWEDAVAKRPTNYRAWYNLGALRLLEEDFDGARMGIEKALDIAPDYADAHIGMGDLLVMEGKLQEAVPSYRRALVLIPDHYAGLYKLSLVLSRLHQFDEAMAGFRTVLEQRPQHQEARFQMAFTLARQGEMATAIALYREVLAAGAPRPPPDLVHLRLGEALWQTNALNLAKQEFLEAVRYDPKNARAQCHLGTVAARRNDTAAALARFRKAVAAHPDYEMAHRGLAEQYLRTRQLDLAEHHAREVLRLQPDSSRGKELLRLIEQARRP